MTRVLLAIDGNSLIHRAYHADARSPYANPATGALCGLVGSICKLVERVRPTRTIIGFDDATTSVRRTEYPDYKAGRAEKNPDLTAQLLVAPKMLAAMGFTVVVPAGLEADDVTAAAPTWVPDDWKVVIATSDRDAFEHITERTNVLRIINGGIGSSPLLGPDALHQQYGVHPGQYLTYAAMRGDSSDNLPGVRGVGEKTAQKLLAAFPTAEAMWEAVDNAPDAVSTAAGKAALTKLCAEGAREAFWMNRDLMTARPVPCPDRVTAPDEFDTATVTAALKEANCLTINQMALRALCGAEPYTVVPADPYAGEHIPPPEEPSFTDPYAGEQLPPPTDPYAADSWDHPFRAHDSGDRHPTASVSGF